VSIKLARPTPLGVAVTAILLLFAAYLQLSPKKGRPDPRPIVVSNCGDPKPGMRRIGEKYGFQFDVPLESFKIVEGAGDAPGEGHGYFLPLRNGPSSLDISWGPEMSDSHQGGVPIPQALISLEHAHARERSILDNKGNPIGMDSWGYLDSGTLWRRVRLPGSVAAEYGSVTEKDVANYGFVHEENAEIFDHVISSACFLSPPES
jgi:hypothetical protein